MLLDGARRVGKSYIAEQFGKNEYKSYILIDFAHLPGEVREVFENDLYDFNLFFNKLSAYYRKILYKTIDRKISISTKNIIKKSYKITKTWS